MEWRNTTVVEGGEIEAREKFDLKFDLRDGYPEGIWFEGWLSRINFTSKSMLLKSMLLRFWRRTVLFAWVSFSWQDIAKSFMELQRESPGF